tara:strand:- start:302 stop:655 length:354 start_codon:yes stop_codon:yes gene_type:complete
MTKFKAIVEGILTHKKSESKPNEVSTLICKEVNVDETLYHKIAKYGLKDDNSVNLNSEFIHKLGLDEYKIDSEKNITLFKTKKVIIKKEAKNLWEELQETFGKPHYYPIIGPPIPSS